MPYANTFRLLDLQPQDRVILHEKCGGYRDSPWDDTVAYVECVDYENEQVHSLSPTGIRRAIPFAEISDVQKSEAPIYATVDESIWIAHKCDPAYLGLPVRVVAVSISASGKVGGLEIPKWPGLHPGKVLTLPARRGVELTLSISDTDLIKNLPSSGFNPRRCGAPATKRNKIYRIAGLRVSKFLATASKGSIQKPPMDPSFVIRTIPASGMKVIPKTEAPHL